MHYEINTITAREANAQMTHIQVPKKKKKKVLVMPLRYTPITQSILCLIFMMSVATIPPYSGQESKNNLLFMILTYLWPWKGQGHKIWYELLDPKQGYNHAKFEWPTSTSVCQKANLKSFCQIRKHINYLPWICANVKNNSIFIIYLTY